MRAACLIVLAALTLAAPAVAGPAPGARSAMRFCPDVTRHGVEVIKMQRALGCRQGPRLAARTVNDRNGVLDTERYYCRWGQGGTDPVTIQGHTYNYGFCFEVDSERQAYFLARRL
jgi:hypothetical protein